MDNEPRTRTGCSSPDVVGGVGLLVLFALISLFNSLCWEGFGCSDAAYVVLLGLALFALAVALWLVVGPTGRQSPATPHWIAGIVVLVAVLSLALRFLAR